MTLPVVFMDATVLVLCMVGVCALACCQGAWQLVWRSAGPWALQAAEAWLQWDIIGAVILEARALLARWNRQMRPTVTQHAADLGASALSAISPTLGDRVMHYLQPEPHELTAIKVACVLVAVFYTRRWLSAHGRERALYLLSAHLLLLKDAESNAQALWLSIMLPTVAPQLSFLHDLASFFAPFSPILWRHWQAWRAGPNPEAELQREMEDATRWEQLKVAPLLLLAWGVTRDLAAADDSLVGLGRQVMASCMLLHLLFMCMCVREMRRRRRAAGVLPLGGHLNDFGGAVMHSHVM